VRYGYKDVSFHQKIKESTLNNRFPNIKTYKNVEVATTEFRLQWVTPYYLNLGKDDDEWISAMKSIKNEITNEIILKCLGDIDWRSRQTGAYFAAIKNSIELTDIIGNHLLKSQVCYAGKQYAVTLAKFNTNLSINYLSEYLNYYLQMPELEFDQIQVFEALKYVDEVNQTKRLLSHKEMWTKFCDVNIGKYEKIINHQRETDEYKKAILRIKAVWNYDRPSTYIRKRIKAINKIIEDS